MYLLYLVNQSLLFKQTIRSIPDIFEFKLPQFSNQLSYRLVYYIKLFKIRCPTILFIIIILKFKALLSYLVKTKNLWRTFWCLDRNFFSPNSFFRDFFGRLIACFWKKIFVSSSITIISRLNSLATRLIGN